MFRWVFNASERWVRANPTRLGTMVNRVPQWYVRGLSEAKLLRTLRHVWHRSPAQRARWQQAGVRRRDLRSPRVLQRLPLTTGEDLVARPEAFLCAPRRELIHVLGTSGTKGRVKRIWLTRDDLDRQLNMIATNLRRFADAERAMALFLVDDPTWSAGSITRGAIEKAGMFGLLSGTHLPTAAQIALIRDYRIDLIVTTPVYLHQLTLDATEDVGALGVKYIQLSGQTWTESFRAEMEATWGAKLIDVYASTECACGIASECVQQNGLHVSEADYWVEVINPDSAEALPDGEEGELVVTTLSRRGMPLVRYRTGDVASLLPRGARCACGYPLRRMSRLRGRIDDMLILGGANNVLPDAIDRAVLSLPGVSDYQLVVERDGYRDLLHLRVEANGDAPPTRDMLVDALLSVTNIAVSHRTERTLDFGRMEVVSPGALSEGRPKTNRIVDHRQKP